MGNHEVPVRWNLNDKAGEKLRELLSNATFLFNEELVIKGIKIYGTSWNQNVIVTVV